MDSIKQQNTNVYNHRTFYFALASCFSNICSSSNTSVIPHGRYSDQVLHVAFEMRVEKGNNKCQSSYPWRSYRPVQIYIFLTNEIQKDISSIRQAPRKQYSLGLENPTNVYTTKSDKSCSDLHGLQTYSISLFSTVNNYFTC
jgi:hypothetical protein